MLQRRMSFGYACEDPEHEARILEALCEGYTLANCEQMAIDPDAFPCCLSCGDINYTGPQNCRIRNWRTGDAVDPDCQHVWGAPALLRRKKGTCIDLACMLAAIYRVKENDHARVIIDFETDPSGAILPGRYHAMVMKENGEIVDPVELTADKKKPPVPIAVGAREVKPSCGCGG